MKTRDKVWLLILFIIWTAALVYLALAIYGGAGASLALVAGGSNLPPGSDVSWAPWKDPDPPEFKILQWWPRDGFVEIELSWITGSGDRYISISDEIVQERAPEGLTEDVLIDLVWEQLEGSDLW